MMKLVKTVLVVAAMMSTAGLVACGGKSNDSGTTATGAATGTGTGGTATGTGTGTGS